MGEGLRKVGKSCEYTLTRVERFNVQARPGATTIIKEINPLLLKVCALDATS